MTVSITFDIADAFARGQAGLLDVAFEIMHRKIAL